MRKLLLAATVAVLSTGALTTTSNAMPLGAGLGAAVDSSGVVEPVTYYYGYRRWYHHRHHHHWRWYRGYRW
jgi:hypothetical protein